MFEIIDQHQKFDEVLQAVEKLLIEQDNNFIENLNGSCITPNEIEELTLKRKEIGLYCLGQLSELIKEEHQSFIPHLTSVISSLIVPILESPSTNPNYLLLRCLWVLSKLSPLTTPSPHLLSLSLSYLSHPSLALRLTSCSLLSTFSSPPTSCLPQILQLLESCS